MITDSEAPTYNFDSDDEVPCEYLNDIYAISEDTFCFKIIKQLGNGYYSPGNGHKIKIIYYELGYEDKIRNVQTYLGKNDKLPYICEVAAKCMRKNEVCIIQAPKAFMKVFKNSEKKNKYDKKDNFKVAFKKSLRFKQKCLEKYLNYPNVTYFKGIKLNSNNIELLLRKKQNKNNNREKDKNEEQTKNNIQINTTIILDKYNESCREHIQNENIEFLKLEEVNNLRYKFLKEEDLCTYVVYLKEFYRVDILNDDKTIIKEVVKEGEGIFTPKKNDYIDYIIREKKKKEYIHMIFDISNLKYRGLFKIMQNMKKKEIAKVTLKGLECFHINYSTSITKKSYNDNINNNMNNSTENIVNFVSYKDCNDNKTIKNNINEKYNCKDGFNDTIKNEDEIIISNELFNEKKEIIIELIDFKRSKTININSLINMNNTEKLLFYISEDDKLKNINKPIIDTDCELIINLSIQNIDKTKNKKIDLPINFYDNNNNIRKSDGYFLFSYGSCFTSPLWFYKCFKGLKEGDEIIIPLSKNRNIFSENQFVYDILYEDIGTRKTHNFPKQYELKKSQVNKNKKYNKLKNKKQEFIKEKKKIINDIKRRKKFYKNLEKKNEKLNDIENFVQNLISDRNEGKGFFLINNFKKNEEKDFCEGLFSLQNYFIEKNKEQENIRKILSVCKSFIKVGRKKKFKIIIEMQKKKRIITKINKFIKHDKENYSYYKCATKKKIKNKGKNYNISFFRNALNKVYFDKFFYQKDTILKIKILKIICKKKDPWNMSISEIIENLKIYNEKGNIFMKKKLIYAALVHYKKGFDLCRFSTLYKLIFEENKLSIVNLEDEQNQVLIILMEKILTNLSICYYKMNNYNECIKYSDKAIIINPQNIKSIYWKNMAHLMQNKYVDVIKNLNNSFCLNDSTLLKLYNNARLIKKKHDDNFKSLFYAIYDKK
ncbi:conserved Plasmodium protein, unknown function [Plasmodium gallinaceum]|uniref:Uncharacterized protein n=1 Tax=Plasmodium gallinaceum TaxID=5849 RepID=A0A1J1GYW0_PLAGA|nr:conserved Plasmodium protein, unknown function [Plasmodium gallinaceum]CRG97425.1 conserved Plasmodium protein, unknown function [Plasmodium gallinaceum]